MKRINPLIFIAFSVLVTFCSKKSEDKPSTPNPHEKFAVTFKVNDFIQSIGDIDARNSSSGQNQKQPGDSLKKYIDHLVMVIYTSNSTFVKQVSQNSSNPDFGVFKDSLPAGDYRISVVGTKDSVPLSYSNPPEAGPSLINLTLPGTDAFYKFMQIGVNGSINQVVVLSRVVAKVKLIIKDRIPFDTKSISIKLSAFPSSSVPDMNDVFSGISLSSGGYYYAVRGQFIYYPLVYNIPDSLRGSTNFTSEFYVLVLPNTTKMTMQLTSNKMDGTVLAQKDIYDISITANKRTILTGNLFDGITTDTSGLSVGIDGRWNADSTVQTF
ncbi:hypothetical protein PV783_03085 [Chitinophaga sp. CC14]|uniref:hypothetical protein n=1 Tax=Chitinophaga sp. CC14 TaxID=3029199 RepID=UPI003B77425C